MKIILLKSELIKYLAFLIQLANVGPLTEFVLLAMNTQRAKIRQHFMLHTIFVIRQSHELIKPSLCDRWQIF